MDLRTKIEGFRLVSAETCNEHIQHWKGEGGAVVGYFCSYVPVELLTAAGLLGIRLRGAGSRDSGPADVYLSSRTCTYVRHTLALALEGSLDFLDGEICLNTCDHVRRAADVWRHKTGVGFNGFISVPRNARESLYPYFKEEIYRLKAALEEHFGSTIAEAKLEEAVVLHNEVRRRLARIDELRAVEKPALSGADMLAMTVASLLTPPAVFLEMADSLLTDLEAAQGPGDPPRARFLLGGTELDEPAFVSALESQGGAVVADTLCFGSRAHQALVDEASDDPLEAVCRRYFFQLSCARMIGNFEDRLVSLTALCEERNVEGVVFQRLKFCDPWGGEAHNMRHRLKELGMPFLFLEREYGRVHAGQVRTRVQAFHELIESAARRQRRTA